MQSILDQLGAELKVRVEQVRAAVDLLDGGATVPFIARYRKEATGGLDDAQLRELEVRLAYLRELARQNITGIQVAARQVLDQVIAGEYSIALNIFNNHAVISAAKGAPSDWIPLNPSMAIPSVISVTKAAQRPNAGKLLVDFLASEDGQKLYRDADYMPIDPAVPPRDPSLRPDGKNFRAVNFTPEEIEANMSRWSGIFKEIFR